MSTALRNRPSGPLPPAPGEDDDPEEPAPVEAARTRARLEKALFTVELTRKIRERREEHVRHLENVVADINADRSSLRTRLEERETYIRVLHGSRGWKFLQGLRGLFGRRWWQ